MTNFTDLVNSTELFFGHHWPQQAVDFDVPPGWTPWSPFLYGPLPNYQCGGCYALFVEDDLVYVGLGVAKGGGASEHHGISRRLAGHVLRRDAQRGRGWYKTVDRWSAATALYTIGFTHQTEYLAPALERFLIWKLDPPKNLV